MERMLWVLAVIAAMLQVIYGQNCRTRSGEVGRCVNIRFCPDLWTLLRQIQTNRAPLGAVRVLRQSVCDFTESLPKVCCRRQQNLENSETSILPENCGRTALQDRIVGGVNASLFAWPWMALLRGSHSRGSLWICGGVLISRRFVLTAAHCVHSSSQYRLDFVRLGEYQLSQNPDCERRVCAPSPQDIPVAEIIIHEGFTKLPDCPRCHDIALLRLAIPAELHPAHVVPVCLPRNLEQDLGVIRSNFSSQFGWVAGWGTVDQTRTVPADVLQEALLPLGRSFCRSASYPDPNMIICAGGEGADSCGGDSGGPLLMENFRTSRSYVVGLVSNGPTVCGAPETQGIYTNVNYYVPWILSRLEP